MHSPSPSRISVVLLALAVCILVALPALADSQARIVRLSDVQGSVQIDKNTGLGFENAFVNLPITQGTQLRTGDRGRAEIEFEDGSSMRLTPNTTVQFSKLSLNDSGKRVSEVNLVQGMAYVNWLGKDDLALDFSHEKLALDRSAHFRVDASSQTADVAVFKGDVNVEGPNGQLSVEKKKTATFDVADNDKSKIENKVAEQPLDSWDKEAISYHDQYAKNTNNSPYGYGLSDMNYYGSYTNVPGYGMLWQPYFAGVGWDPFMDGAWGFYPGYGYMFASAYPWGWLPYHYGSWTFLGNGGWFWVPGNFYRNNGWWGNGFQPVPVVHGPAGWLPPTRPPVPGVGVASSAPVVRVGTIGNMPPAIPGGRVPPNFRSVVPASIAPGATDRALNVPNRGVSPYVPPTARKAGSMPVTVAPDTRAIYGQYAGATVHPSGHVFAPPTHAAPPGYGVYGGGGYGEAGHGMGAAPAVGTSHAMGPTGGHSTGGGTPHSGGGGHGGPR